MMDNSKPPDPACKYFLSQFACAKAFVLPVNFHTNVNFKLQKQMLKVMGLNLTVLLHHNIPYMNTHF